MWISESGGRMKSENCRWKNLFSENTTDHCRGKCQSESGLLFACQIYIENKFKLKYCDIPDISCDSILLRYSSIVIHPSGSISKHFFSPSKSLLRLRQFLDASPCSKGQKCAIFSEKNVSSFDNQFKHQVSRSKVCKIYRNSPQSSTVCRCSTAPPGRRR